MIARLFSKEHQATGHRWVWWPGCLVILSSWAWASYALFFDPTDPQTFQGWNIRILADSWLKTHGWFSFLHSPWFQMFWFVLCWGLGTLGAWFGYLAFLRKEQPDLRTLQHAIWIIFVSVFAILPQWWVPSMWSSDVYLYSMYGRIAQEHRGNPLVQSGLTYRTICLPASGTPKIAQPGKICHSSHTCPPGTQCKADPYVTRTPWNYQPSAYGPLAIVLFRWLHHPQATPAQNARNLRIFFGLCLLALGLVVFGLAGLPAMAICLWSPVSWIESANGGHLEALQMFLVCGAFFGLRTHSPGLWTGLCLGLAGSIKVTMAIFMIPVALFLWNRPERWKQSSLFVFLGLSIIAIGYTAMWGEPHPFLGLVMESQKTVHSLLHLTRVGLHLTTGHDLYHLLRLLGGGIVLYIVFSFFRGAPHTAMYEQMTELWLVLTLFALGAFHPWHTLVGLCLASLLHHRHPLQRSWLWISITAPLVYYGSDILGHHLSFSWLWLLLVPCLIFLVPCALWIWSKTKKLYMLRSLSMKKLDTPSTE